MLPYFAAARIIIYMLAGERELSQYLPWLGLGLAGYAARTTLYNMALSISHKATFSILKTIRQKKLPMLPLGTVMNMSSGKMKQIIVDQADGMVFMMSIIGSYRKDYEGAVRTTQEMSGTFEAAYRLIGGFFIGLNKFL